MNHTLVVLIHLKTMYSVIDTFFYFSIKPLLEFANIDLHLDIICKSFQ